MENKIAVDFTEDELDQIEELITYARDAMDHDDSDLYKDIHDKIGLYMKRIKNLNAVCDI